MWLIMNPGKAMKGFRLLVERVENILANTTSEFIETHQSARDTGSSETWWIVSIDVGR